ncbi:MAG: metallophosphoesterase family protein [Alphaproteobacteria bacterium]|nr:metallophosphoesterase family protein [Alphaproteobacteria bacterium]
MRLWFTSDTHFGHAGALHLYKRPFASVGEMDEALIARWNAAVAPDDAVWHLGDFAIRQSADRTAALLDRLNGVKHLVIGNNDPPGTHEQPGWASVQHYAELVIAERRLVLCHFPFRSWRDMARGAVNLHGHSHGRMKPMTRQYDVGVDVRDFAPAMLEDILAPRRRG